MPEDKQLIFTVVAYRYGDKEKHSYIVACTFDYDQAVDAADKEEVYRGGKYCCCVEQAVVGEYNQDGDGPFITYETPAFSKAQAKKPKKLEERIQALAYLNTTEGYYEELRDAVKEVKMPLVKGYQHHLLKRRSNILDSLIALIEINISKVKLEKRTLR